MLSRESIRRSVSVDFTLPAALRPLLAFGYAADSQHVAPIATLEKDRLRRFDLVDEGNCSLPLVSRAQNEEIAHHALLAACQLAVDHEDLGPIEPELSDVLRRVAAGPADEATGALELLLEDAKGGEPQRHAIVQDPRASNLLLDLTYNYVLLVVLNAPARRRVVKFSWDDFIDQADERTGLRSGLGWMPLTIETEVAAAIRTKSYHAEVEVPEDLRIVGSVILDRRNHSLLAFDTDADRAALHAPDVPPAADPILLFGVRAERVGFPTVAWVVAAVIAALLSLGAFWGDLDPGKAGPPISVLLAASAVFSGLAASRGQHPLVQRLFIGPRLCLLVSALAALAAASTLAFGLGAPIIEGVWKVAAVVATVSSIMLVVTAWRSAPASRTEPL